MARQTVGPITVLGNDRMIQLSADGGKGFKARVFYPASIVKDGIVVETQPFIVVDKENILN